VWQFSFEPMYLGEKSAPKERLPPTPLAK